MKFTIFLFLSFLFLFGCTVNSEKSSQAIDPIYLDSEQGITRAIVSFVSARHDYAPYLNRDRFNAIVQFKRDHVTGPVIW